MARWMPILLLTCNFNNKIDFYSIVFILFSFSSCRSSICRTAEPADIGISLSSKRNDLYYSMDNNINGRCIILNYECFDAHDLNPRKGTKTDVRKLNSTFKMLNFDVQTYDDLTLQKTFEVLKQGCYF